MLYSLTGWGEAPRVRPAPLGATDLTGSSRSRWTLTFDSEELEAAYVESSLAQNSGWVRLFLGLLSSISGSFLIVVVFLELAYDPIILSILGAATALPALELFLLWKTKFGRRHEAGLSAALMFVLFSLLVSFYANMLFTRAAGSLREPGGEEIPRCTTVENSGGLRPIDLNYTVSAIVREAFYEYSGEACFDVPSQQVVETRFWSKAGYNRERVQLAFFNALAYWLTFGISAALLMSMRFKYAAFAVALPALPLWFAYVTAFPGVGNVAGSITLFVPALAAICGVTRRLELSYRDLFLENLAVQRMLEEKDAALRAKSRKIQNKQTQIATMHKRLHAANEQIFAIMSDGGSVLAQYEMPYSDLEFGGPCGEGSNGTVFLAKMRGQHYVAVKTLRVGKLNSVILHKFKSELIIMAPLHHENLVFLHGGVWSEGADKLCIVLEYCANGSMAVFLGSEVGTWEGLRQPLAVGTARGLRYLHHGRAQTLIHRDVKPANILVNSALVPKLADFGESTIVSRTISHRHPSVFSVHAKLAMSIVGTKFYCAPEVMRGDRYDESADTFSFSLVLLGLVTGSIDYVHTCSLGGNGGNFSYVDGWRPPIPHRIKQAEPAITALIEGMWRQSPYRRPSMNEVVALLEEQGNGGVVDDSPGDAGSSSSVGNAAERATQDSRVHGERSRSGGEQQREKPSDVRGARSIN